MLKPLFFGTSLVSVLFVAGCAADSAPDGDAAQSEDAVTALPVAINETLFRSPNGLKNCTNAELVTNITTEHGLLPTYPPQAFHKATLGSFYRACSGMPVPASYVPGPTVSLERFSLGCGSFLFRGAVPGGGTLEVYDHRNARGGWGCGTPSANPVIVRYQGELLYALNRNIACTSLATQAACDSRVDCKSSWVSLPIYPPQPPILKCDSHVIYYGNEPVDDQP